MSQISLNGFSSIYSHKQVSFTKTRKQLKVCCHENVTQIAENGGTNPTNYNK